jgi:hypothetical protein
VIAGYAWWTFSLDVDIDVDMPLEPIRGEL